MNRMDKNFSGNDYVTIARLALTSCFSGPRGSAAFSLARIVIGSVPDNTCGRSEGMNVKL